jgi:photosystem II stability/assembly factor-like uncharacterized protein
MKKVIIFITVLVFNSDYSNSQTGWFQQTSGTSINLNAVYAVDANIIFGVGNSGGILKTTNGGSNWTLLNSGNTDTLFSVFFTDINTGIVCGSLGMVLRTTNSGLNWSSMTLIPQRNLRSVYFPPSGTGNTGYICGTAQIFKTINAGLNWTPMLESGPDLYSIYFTDALTGYACGSGGAIIKSTNGGTGWLSQTSGTSATLRAIQFINSSTGWTAGTDSKLYKTTNGGTTWAMYYNQSLCGLYSVYFTSEQTGWVCGCEGAINGTTNNGANWILQSFASTLYLYSMSFASPLTGWAVGTGGRILKTTSGGITFIQPVSNEIPDKFFLYQNYPNPFNPSTKIKFDITLPLRTSEEETEGVKLSIYDILGKKISTLVNGQLKPGSYEIEWDASNYPSGVYYYRLEACPSDRFNRSDGYNETKKMVLIK